MSALLITNRTRGTVLGSEVMLADGWWSRLRGYLGRAKPESGQGILLAPCKAIHTMGMSFPIDVLFLDRGGKVLASLRGVQPWRGARRVSAAKYVLEVPEGTIEATGTEPGDELAWSPQRSPSAAANRANGGQP